MKLLFTGLFHPDSENRQKILDGMVFFCSAFLVVAISGFLNSLWKLHINIFIIILGTLLFTGLHMLYDRNKKNLLFYLIFAGCILVLAGFDRIFKWNFVLWGNKVYQWCLTYDRQEDGYNKWFALTVLLLLLFLLSGIAYILHRIRHAKYLLALGLLGAMVAASIYKVYLPKLSVGIALLYCLVVLTEACGRLCFKNSGVDERMAAVYLVPVCLLAVTVSMLLPSDPKPMKWKGVKSFVYSVQELGSTWLTDVQYYLSTGEGEFSLNYADYTENGKGDLGGSVRAKKKNSLIVAAQVRSTSRGYLIGSISDIYTGRRWERSDRDKSLDNEDYYLDFCQLLFAFTREYEQGKDLANLVEDRNFQIEYRNIRTNSLFYPLKTYSVLFQNYVNYYSNAQGALLFQKSKGKGTLYKVRYYELNLNSDTLKDMLRKGEKNTADLSEEEIQKTAKDLFHYDTSEVKFNPALITAQLEEREKEIRTDYTLLPASLPQRVKALAEEITQGCTNDYDRMKALEAYLNGIPYSLAMEKTPEEEDFVDYFLFHQKKGYCSYFASAMAVMARCVGIPTRYVEGFVVDYKEGAGTDKYKVFSKNAHSWVDAYIDGIGWIPFEPTPPFQAGRYVRWKEENQVIGYHDSGVTLHDDIQARLMQQEYEKKQWEKAAAQKISKERFKLLAVVLVIGVFFLFLLIFYLYYKILELKYYKKFKGSPDSKKVSMVMTEVLRYLALEGYHLSSDETLAVFAGRIGRQFEFDYYNFISLSELFMRVRYGEKETNEYELRAAGKYSKDFEKHLYSKYGKWKMFFDRFVFLHFNQ